jgi:hypothetical protein
MAALRGDISFRYELNVVEKICHESKYLQAVDQSNYYYSKLGARTSKITRMSIDCNVNDLKHEAMLYHI